MRLGGSEGQSKESAEAALSAIPGVSEGSVNTSSMVSGLQEETNTTIEVHVETGFSVPDPEALVDYLIGVAWSAKTKEATSDVEVIVLSDPQISIVDAVEAGPWVLTGSDPNFPEEAVVDAPKSRTALGTGLARCLRCRMDSSSARRRSPRRDPSGERRMSWPVLASAPVRWCGGAGRDPIGMRLGWVGGAVEGIGRSDTVSDSRCL